jgi:hypothetical protein
MLISQGTSMADGAVDTLEYSKLLSKQLDPLGGLTKISFLTDKRTGAVFCECYVRASKLIALGTVDVPLDPEEQAEYRANRELAEDAYAFERMKEDAKAGRTFSGIVAEYNDEFDEEHPIKIIGGQHRFVAIKTALEAGIDEFQGLKLYVGLNKEQRLDVQLISNTNIAISGDLYDRMQETVRGPDLRNWCHNVGLLEKGKDFADKRERGGIISVQVARTFITNYFAGKQISEGKFETTDTTPTLSPSGRSDPEWETLLKDYPELWTDAGLTKAAKEFARLVEAQRAAFKEKKPRPPADHPDKAMNLAVIAAWAFVAGMYFKNTVRLKRHFELADKTGRDPLNASALAKGRHRTDPENYRGLGYRTDAKERGRLVELFADQTEDGTGITSSRIDVAIKQFHAKQAQLEVIRAKEKEKG